ncbi:unnamed protein product [Protopolystoma xenopodis]|uniref:Uncharacterized protein n=1 Tax=Protopolystoma xenopodis TaxID=117903 RepID=A0A448XHY5_9PLAT|nr:unnamed protein product [Protopolystoma xenopodis]
MLSWVLLNGRQRFCQHVAVVNCVGNRRVGLVGLWFCDMMREGLLNLVIFSLFILERIDQRLRPIRNNPEREQLSIGLFPSHSTPFGWVAMVIIHTCLGLIGSPTRPINVRTALTNQRQDSVDQSVSTAG